MEIQINTFKCKTYQHVKPITLVHKCFYDLSVCMFDTIKQSTNTLYWVNYFTKGLSPFKTMQLSKVAHFIAHLMCDDYRNPVTN